MGSEFDINMVSVKGILGGNLSDSFFLKGILIKKPFSYAGYEKQNKKIYYPAILLLDIELEIKTEKDQNQHSLLLEVRASNVIAIKLYESIGFQLDGTRKDYYPSASGREDARLYSLSLG